ncbi:sugar ABC transporter ATP-binding protein [Umezawaea tangerina]|uniref:Monosaccharide ABC transporter ATP-binding protein (CUT2 family) n=1 Tax=Umezawaea tangerina TaxID=84725 RepID=A0A2T0T7Y0_9PSEU|nr:sugar ABC transporter ATP-binding protein [Umezawaea tangerina]PRY41784.1 monosaccharide ABC transporter ATP-binding protein (CUT2 family) [Umezawaea tangerina]
MDLPPDPPLVLLEGVSKSFGAVRALTDVTLALAPGEAHALLGENGAGKSTLIKTLAGVHRPDAGRLLVDGEEARFSGPADAKAAGIAVIYQEPALFGDLSIAENVYTGRQPLRSGRRIDTRAMHADTTALFTRLGVVLDPARPARGLSIADQQMVEIAKALSFDARVVVMDEPTAALSAREVERLFAVVELLREQGAAVLFVSHRLDEVFSLCQRATVLRDGKHVWSGPLTGETPDGLVRRMVGRELSALFPKQDTEAGDVLLSVSRLTREGVFTDVSFDVRAGEIVGLSGLVGAGRSEVARAIFGIDGVDAGEVAVGGKPLRLGSPTAAMAAGIGFVPEDRRQQGLVVDASVERNVALASLGRLSWFGLLFGRGERRLAEDWAIKLSIKAGRLGAAVSTLSGGNQQKVVLAKWLSRRPSVLIVDEPTRGIDVGTKAEVHRLLSELASEGVAVLMISSELPEVLGMADRVLVMHEGRLVEEIARADATEERVALAAAGRSGAES